jgi:hypothetical protein
MTTDINRELHPAGTRARIARLERELADARGEAALLRSELATVKADAATRIDALTHLFCRANAEKREWREVAGLLADGIVTRGANSVYNDGDVYSEDSVPFPALVDGRG